MNISKFLFSVLLSSTVVIAGCGANNQTNDQTVIDGNELDQFDNTGNTTGDDEITSKLGYVHYNKDEINLDAENNHMLKIDRNKMADAITRMILRNEEFNDVATLVTDEEVLIAYSKSGDIDRDEAATIVKKTATSVLPRFYHVYVSDQPVSFRDIQSLQNSNTLNDDYDNTLENIIDDMKDSPQGEKLYEESDSGNDM